jgi:hypothetical protein
MHFPSAHITLCSQQALFQSRNESSLETILFSSNVGKTVIIHPPVITIFVGGMVPFPVMGGL